MRRGRRTPQLRHFATIRSVSHTTDGETKPTFSDLVTSVPAERKQRGGREVVSNDQTVPVSDEVIKMHYRADVKPTMRVTFATTGGGTEALEVVNAADVDGDRRWLTLDCKRLQST